MAVQIELGGKTRTLKLNLGTIAEIEDKLDGLPLVDAYLRILKRGINATVVALWAAMKHEDPTLTVPLTRKTLQSYLDDGGDFQAVTDALSAAFKDVGVFNKDSDEGNAQPEPASAI